ncbi:MAG TPA: MerR family transcriptional regulator, partial [Acidobacteriota bacterium]|nr:MerR family transcriptional regulator [Acidobacteriota bacterium]
MDYFSVQQASKMLGLSPGRLRHWEKIQFVTRSIRNDQGSFYSFQDLLSLKAASELISGGVSLKQVARSLDIIRKKFPEIKNLSELKFFSKHNRLFMRYNGLSFDPVSGQMLLNFEEEQKTIAKTFPSRHRGKDHLFWFEYGLRYDVEGKWQL